MTDGRDVLDFLDDIVGAMEAALEFVAGMDAEQFRSDRKTTFAVIRALEMVGEATSGDYQHHPTCLVCSSMRTTAKVRKLKVLPLPTVFA